MYDMVIKVMQDIVLSKGTIATDRMQAQLGLLRMQTSVRTGVDATKAEKAQGGDLICNETNDADGLHLSHPSQSNVNKKLTMSNTRDLEGKKTSVESSKKVDAPAENTGLGDAEKSGPGRNDAYVTNLCSTTVLSKGPNKGSWPEYAKVPELAVQLVGGVVLIIGRHDGECNAFMQLGVVPGDLNSGTYSSTVTSLVSPQCEYIGEGRHAHQLTQNVASNPRCAKSCDQPTSDCPGKSLHHDRHLNHERGK